MFSQRIFGQNNEELREFLDELDDDEDNKYPEEFVEEREKFYGKDPFYENYVPRSTRATNDAEQINSEKNDTCHDLNDLETGRKRLAIKVEKIETRKRAEDGTRQLGVIRRDKEIRSVRKAA
jgi:hypothetical protein